MQTALVVFEWMERCARKLRGRERATQRGRESGREKERGGRAEESERARERARAREGEREGEREIVGSEDTACPMHLYAFLLCVIVSSEQSYHGNVRGSRHVTFQFQRERERERERETHTHTHTHRERERERESLLGNAVTVHPLVILLSPRRPPGPEAMSDASPVPALLFHFSPRILARPATHLAFLRSSGR